MLLYSLSYTESMMWSISSFNPGSVFKSVAPLDCNSPLAHRLFLRCAALLVSLLVPLVHIQAQTHAEMNATARSDFARADADLNKTYQAVLAKLRDTETKQKLREAQRVWVVSHDAGAARAAKDTEGGSNAPTLRYEAMTQLTRERIKELEAMLDHGTGSGPKPTATGAPPASPASTPESVQHDPQIVAAESPVTAQQPANSEKIRDVSPDKKFAMRIRYDAELNKQMIKAEKADAEKIFSQTIKTIELVSLPDKYVVADFSADQKLGGEYDYILLVWSADSKWCAFYAAAPRIGYTTVYRPRGNEFVLLNEPQELSVEIEGNANHEYIRPVEWTQPGVLVLEQSATFLHGSGDERPIRFTAKFDEKTDKFRIISKKRVTSGLPHGYD
jgi:uncharacterized protein YecT (DUF1311 family)